MKVIKMSWESGKGWNGWFAILIASNFLLETTTCNHQFSEPEQWGFLLPSSPEKFSCNSLTNLQVFDPVDTVRKLNVQNSFRRRPGRLLNVLCTFNFRPVSTGIMIHSLTTSHWTTSHWIASMFVYLLHKHFALVTTR